ncbi:colicin import membrane protein [Polaromonas sp. CG_9.5]|uniref:DNA-binding protein n=1 Tax=Polaromonas sp. CG_9.5 TaxID=3071705 RepID=UPI002E03F3F2|nr:colicin import membrane protein [Polaromonas sp. CG_9.5]
MRNPEIPDQDIVKAGQELLAVGRLVNGYALRTKTGGGKPERLLKVWEEHVSGQTAVPFAPVATELPLEMAEELAAVTQALCERMAALANSLNNKAVQAAERRVHQIQRSADEQSGKDKAELADAAVVVNELQTKLSQAETEEEAHQKALADAQALNEVGTRKLSQLGDRLATQERESQAAGLGHAAQLDGLNKLLEDERSSHQDAVKMQRDELLEQSKNASDTREALNKEVAIAKAETAAARQALSQQEASVQKRLEAAETKLGNAGQAASTAREDAARLGGQVHALQVQVTELMRVIATRLAVQDSKGGIAAGTGQVETTRLMPDSGSPVLQS